MSINKPTKPDNEFLPNGFGTVEGVVKNDFSETKKENGFSTSIKDIFQGDNLNYMLDTIGKQLKYLTTIVDFINETPTGKAVYVNSNNKLDYQTFISDVDNKANVSLNNLDTTGQAIINNKEDKSNKTTYISASSTNTQYPTSKCVYDAVNTKQNTLISGTNIKTINGNSVLGSGNISTSEIPSQAGNNGKFLTTSGLSLSWATIDTSDKANTSLSNLNSTGEARFTNKANTSLSNLNSTGEAKFANPLLSNLTAGLKNTIANTIPTTSSSANSYTPSVVIDNYRYYESGYIVFSDKLCIQWGYNNTSTNATISLIKNYNNINYIVLTQNSGSSVLGYATNDQMIRESNKTGYSFVCNISFKGFYWLTVGYIS